jgi:hypothetical protein
VPAAKPGFGNVVAAVVVPTATQDDEPFGERSTRYPVAPDDPDHEMSISDVDTPDADTPDGAAGTAAPLVVAETTLDAGESPPAFVAKTR